MQKRGRKTGYKDTYAEGEGFSNLSVFAKRLRLEMDAQDVNAPKLSEMTGLAKSQITKYMKDQQEPRLTSIVKICEALKVSSDWLTGLSDVKSSDIQVVELCKKVGLSEKAAERLTNGLCLTDLAAMEHPLDHKSFIARFANLMLSSNGFTGILDPYESYIGCCNTLKSKNKEETPFSDRDDKHFYTTQWGARGWADVFARRVGDSVYEILCDSLPKEKQSLKNSISNVLVQKGGVNNGNDKETR